MTVEEINNAISAILKTGQSYKIGSRQLTRADLSTLYAMKKELEANETSSSGLGRSAAAVYFDKR